MDNLAGTMRSLVAENQRSQNAHRPTRQSNIQTLGVSIMAKIILVVEDSDTSRLIATRALQGAQRDTAVQIDAGHDADGCGRTGNTRKRQKSGCERVDDEALFFFCIGRGRRQTLPVVQDNH